MFRKPSFQEKTEFTIGEKIKSEMALFALVLRAVTLITSTWDYEVKNKKTLTAFSSPVTNTA